MEQVQSAVSRSTYLVNEGNDQEWASMTVNNRADAQQTIAAVQRRRRPCARSAAARERVILGIQGLKYTNRWIVGCQRRCRKLKKRS